MLVRPAAAVALLLALTACSSAPAAPAAPAAARAVSRPEPSATPAAALRPVPAPGTVQRLAGPFDDRFTLSGTSLRDGVVRTSLSVTSDVSELLVLETQADLYDARGALLGSVRAHHEDPETAHTPHERVSLTMTAPPAYRSRVASAVLSVPVLVNE